MKHLSEEELVLHHYHEGDDWENVQGHLESCSDCRERYQELVRLLSAVGAARVPERDAAYGTRVWQRLRPRLEERPRFSWRGLLDSFQAPALPRWAWATVMVLLAATAFWAGAFQAREAAVDVEQLRSELEGSLKVEFQREFDSQLQAALAQVRDENQQIRAGEAGSASAELASTFVTRSEWGDLWAEFVQSYARSREQDRREILALRRDLETLVMEADSRLELTRKQIGHLAALTRPTVGATEPSVEPQP